VLVIEQFEYFQLPQMLPKRHPQIMSRR